jgi:putative SOS response-associated peptidase YedK
MPVILKPRDYQRWLEPGDPQRLPVDLLKAYPSEEMKSWKVSKDVGNVRNDHPGLCLESMVEDEPVDNREIGDKPQEPLQGGLFE